MATHANFGVDRIDNRETVPAVVAAHASRGLRRIIGREQGRALETLSHAVDYLYDGYLHEGAEDEIIHLGKPSTEALGILIHHRRELLWSLPVAEPVMLRFWSFIFRRTRCHESEPVW